MSQSDFSIDVLNLKQLKQLQTYIPELAGFPSRVLADTYDEFIDVLYTDIDRIVLSKEENPELYASDTEDRITIEIKNSLRLLGYEASHEEKVGGHADLVVRKKDFLWIGEAKIYRGCAYLWQGFLQLTTRYSTGDYNQKHGGLLIYIFHENATGIINNWKDYLAKKNLEGYIDKLCLKRNLAFFSNHQHEKSGELFQVKHIGIMLYFDPKDKSGTRREKKGNGQ